MWNAFYLYFVGQFKHAWIDFEFLTQNVSPKVTVMHADKILIFFLKVDEDYMYPIDEGLHSLLISPWILTFILEL